MKKLLLTLLLLGSGCVNNKWETPDQTEDQPTLIQYRF